MREASGETHTAQRGGGGLLSGDEYRACESMLHGPERGQPEHPHIVTLSVVTQMQIK